MINKRQTIINIVTCFENEPEIIEYAKELSIQQHNSDVCLVVVMNKTSMNINIFKQNLCKEKSNSIIYYPSENLGYLNGLIFGYENYIMEHPKPDWVIMSNTDIKYRDSNFFTKFLESEYDTNIWCVAPSVYSLQNNTYENPQYIYRHSLKGLKKRLFIFQRPKFAYYYLKLANLKSKIINKKRKSSQYVYSAHGCYFILRSDLADLLMENRYGVLMYSEEAFIAEHIRLNNKKCFYDHNIEVIHKGSTVTSKLDIKKKANYLVESLQYIINEFYR